MPHPERNRRPPFDLIPTATFLIDSHGDVAGWSQEAQNLLGYPAKDVLGAPGSGLLVLGADVAVPWADGMPGETPTRRDDVVRARHRDGRIVTLGVRSTPVVTPDRSWRWQVAALDLGDVPWWDTSHSVLTRFLTRSPYGIAVLDPELRYVWLNRTLEDMAGVTMAERVGRRMGEVLPGLSPDQVERQMRSVLDSGVPVLDFEYTGYVPADPDRKHTFSTSFMRLDDHQGRVMGLCYMGVDVTERRRTRERLTLLTDAGTRLGATLDLTTTAEELTAIAVPRLADFAVVDLLEPVLTGEEPKALTPDSPSLLRRMAHASHHDGTPEAVTELGRAPRYPASSPMVRCLTEGSAVLHRRLDPSASDWLAEDAERQDSVTRWGLRSLIVVPVRARGTVLGLATFVRTGDGDLFDDEDLTLAEDLVSRAAVCLDNARRYTRERSTALALQQSLLPGSLPPQDAVDVAYRYLPESDGAVGGDWFDVIPLSGARVALVVGDVTGHGLDSAAAMGRLRTAVHTLSDLDLPPDELLARLDDVVLRLVDEETADGSVRGAASAAMGTTCLYAVYDPTSRHCTMARAGHIPPTVVMPDGQLLVPEMPACPPLGVGALPFESAEFDLPPGSTLVLFTDGLLDALSDDYDTARELLGSALSFPADSPAAVCDHVMAAIPSRRRRDDIALLVARTRELGADQVAEWSIGSDPALVAGARARATETLAAWDLDHLAFTTELFVSELVTNAIRHATGPITLRLIRHSVLVCEVADGSSTSPRLKHARTTDEGGRGLFLIAQMAHRWGTRYTPTGKVIWAEQQLAPPVW
ncbi:SpoIIE family protein phosphatase [Streptomyces gardneri]|uniref:SpoIIE family protein phosphatase n=1 Tax=Streptomyces gardneri TaxID=66892 RepID=UPI0036A741B6